jgi:hypothetical protein
MGSRSVLVHSYSISHQRDENVAHLQAEKQTGEKLTSRQACDQHQNRTAKILEEHRLRDKTHAKNKNARVNHRHKITPAHCHLWLPLIG